MGRYYLRVSNPSCFGRVFINRKKELSNLDLVGDVRYKGMLMGIELVSDKNKKTPIQTKKSINNVIFEEGKKHNVFFRTLGNIIMLVPPLAISEKELNFLIDGTIKTINGVSKKIV